MLEAEESCPPDMRTCHRAGHKRDVGALLERNDWASVSQQNPDADLPGRSARDKGENNRSLVASDTKTRPLNQGIACQSEFLANTAHLGISTLSSAPSNQATISSTRS
jgi:hypothetical protein